MKNTFEYQVLTEDIVEKDLAEDMLLFDSKAELTPEEQAQWDYRKKCRSLCKEIGLELNDNVLDFEEDFSTKIVEFLLDDHKVKKAQFLLKNQVFL